MTIRYSPQVAYSHGGNLFAASTGGAVTLYDSYSLEVVSTLHAHMAHVTSLAWSADDNHLSTGGADGMAYTMCVNANLARVHETRLYKGGGGVASVAILSRPRGHAAAATSLHQPGVHPGTAASAFDLSMAVLVVGGGDDPRRDPMQKAREQASLRRINMADEASEICIDDAQA